MEHRLPSWVRAVAIIGIGYALVGILFAIPATHAQAWRLAAWGVSAMAFGAHLAYERFRLKTSPAPAALHIALAVALGAFGLAAGATIHSLVIGATARHTQLLLLSLGIWPVITAVPAFLVALGSSVALARVFR